MLDGDSDWSLMVSLIVAFGCSQGSYFSFLQANLFSFVTIAYTEGNSHVYRKRAVESIFCSFPMTAVPVCKYRFLSSIDRLHKVQQSPIVNNSGYRLR